MTVFVRNPSAEPELRAQPMYEAAMAAKAVQLAGYIRIAAESSRRTGYYIRRIVPVGSRVEVRDWAWHLVEWGSVNNPPYAPVRRGVIMSGLRFADEGPSQAQ